MAEFDHPPIVLRRAKRGGRMYLFVGIIALLSSAYPRSLFGSAAMAAISLPLGAAALLILSFGIWQTVRPDDLFKPRSRLLGVKRA
jgi:hypothetical protein